MISMSFWNNYYFEHKRTIHTSFTRICVWKHCLMHTSEMNGYSTIFLPFKKMKIGKTYIT